MSKKLKECCAFQEGYVNPSQKDRSYFGGNINWLRSMDLNNSHVYDTSQHLSEKGFISAGKSAYLFPKQSIVISKSGTIGELGILENEMCGNRAVIDIVVDKNKADLMYVFYTLVYKKNEIISKAVGSIQKNLYISELETIILDEDNIEIQHKISNVLKSIDDKISNNNKICSELEFMAKTIYDYWFLQFDFPDENGKPYKSSGGKMVWNEELKREIPERWNFTTIGEITENHDSKRIPLSEKERKLKKGNIPYYGATGIFGYVNEPIFDGDYVLIAEDGSVMDDKGYPIIQRIYGKAWVNNHAHVLKPTNGYHCKLLMMILKQIPVVMIKTGSIQMKINQTNLNEYVIIDVPMLLKEKINKILDPIDNQIIHLQKENQQLSSLRDFLLPMLMNGQVTFKENEA